MSQSVVVPKHGEQVRITYKTYQRSPKVKCWFDLVHIGNFIGRNYLKEL